MLVGLLKAREKESRWRDYMAQMTYEAARGMWAIRTAGKGPFPYASWLQMSMPHASGAGIDDSRTGQEILDDVTAEFRKRVNEHEAIRAICDTVA